MHIEPEPCVNTDDHTQTDKHTNAHTHTHTHTTHTHTNKERKRVREREKAREIGREKAMAITMPTWAGILLISFKSPHKVCLP